MKMDLMIMVSYKAVSYKKKPRLYGVLSYSVAVFKFCV